MSKILIFGYAGFVGPYLAKEYIKDGYEVVGVDIDNSLSFKDVKYIASDILDFDKVKEIILTEKPDIIANLAAISSVGQSWKIPTKTMEINVLGSLNILEASKNLDKKPKILFVGSSEEYEISDKPMDENTPINANNPYGISKVTQEKIAGIYRGKCGFKIFCVRPFNHTGVGQRNTFVLPSFCKQVADIEKSKKPGTIFVGNLEIFRDFSDVRDIVKAYKLILESDNDKVIYNIGSGEVFSLKDLLTYIISLSSQKIDICVDKNIYRPADNKFICCDNRLIRQKLGWAPCFNLKDTLKEMYSYYLNK